MPILLDTPFDYDAGHGQPSETYGEINIVSFKVNTVAKELSMLLEYGNTVDGEWNPGKAPRLSYDLEDAPAAIGAGGVEEPADPAFSTLVGTSLVPAGSEGEQLYNVVGRSLYQHLIDKGIYVGTIV